MFWVSAGHSMMPRGVRARLSHAKNYAAQGGPRRESGDSASS